MWTKASEKVSVVQRPSVGHVLMRAENRDDHGKQEGEKRVESVVVDES